MEGLRKGIPKQRSLNLLQTLQQKPDEDPSEFLQRIHQAYSKYTDADPEAPEDVRMINMTVIGAECSRYQEQTSACRSGTRNDSLPADAHST